MYRPTCCKHFRWGVTLYTRHAHSKYIIDKRMFTIQFKNGRWSENISLKNLLKLKVNLSSCLNLFLIWDYRIVEYYRVCRFIDVVLESFFYKRKEKSQISEKKLCIWTINYDSLNKNTISLKQYTTNLAVPCDSHCEITVTTECKQTKHRHITYF
jgi:hypothetical protein